jgi:hypothetical protein
MDMEGETTGVDIESSWLFGSVPAGLRGGFGTGIAMLLEVLRMDEGLDGPDCLPVTPPAAEAVVALFGELPVFTEPLTSSRLILPSFLSFVSFVESISSLPLHL